MAARRPLWVPLTTYDQVQGFGRVAVDDLRALGRSRVHLLCCAAREDGEEAGLRNRAMLAAWQGHLQCVARTGMGAMARTGMGAVAHDSSGPDHAGLDHAGLQHAGQEHASAGQSRAEPSTEALAAADCVSHYFARLSFCRSAELREWFVRAETALFVWRFSGTALDADQAAFVRTQRVLGAGACMPLDTAEFAVHENDVRAATGTTFCAASAACFYKVQFEHAADAVRSRRAFLKDGWAYVHRNDVVGALAQAWHVHLGRSLAQLAVKWPTFARLERDRLLPLAIQLAAGKDAGKDAATTHHNSAHHNSAHKNARQTLQEPRDVVAAFARFVRGRGHSDFKVKPLGKDVVAFGQWSKVNETDRACPFAQRVHRHNTVSYLVFVRDGAMIQRCWDTGCRGRFQRFVLQDGRVVAAQVSTVPGEVRAHVLDTSARLAFCTVCNSACARAQYSQVRGGAAGPASGLVLSPASDLVLSPASGLVLSPGSALRPASGPVLGPRSGPGPVAASAVSLVRDVDPVRDFGPAPPAQRRFSGRGPVPVS